MGQHIFSHIDYMCDFRANQDTCIFLLRPYIRYTTDKNVHPSTGMWVSGTSNATMKMCNYRPLDISFYISYTTSI